jgi:antitoxin ParD1/3/4
MTIPLPPQHEQRIRHKLQTGNYQSAEEILDLALNLLDQHEQAETEWIEDIRPKIDAAIAISETTAPLDGETVINQILDRFQQIKSEQT